MRAWTLTEALAYGRGTERPFLCPVHGDSRPSASVNVLKKRWYCYTCGARGNLTGEALLMEPDYERLAKDLRGRQEASGRTYPEAWLARFDAGPTRGYWIERFDEPTARRWRLGFDETTDCYTYPLRSTSGEVLGVVRRQPAGALGPKYLYPRGVDVSRLLSGYASVPRDAVVLVEGFLDAVALSMVGVHAFAIYGSRLSEHQVRLVDKLDPLYVYTAFDKDDAGYAAHQSVVRAFPHRAVARMTWPASWGKDVAELGLDQRKRVVASFLNRGLGCVECPTCESPAQTTIPSSSNTSKPSRRLRVLSDV